MKKYLLFIISTLPLTVLGEPYKFNGVYYKLNAYAQTAEVTNEEGGDYAYYNQWATYSNSTITIEPTVKYNGIEYSVTSIGDYAFCYCTNLTSITIPNSVTSIGECAFYQCQNLSSVTTPTNLKSIKHNAFYNCKELASIDLPNSITKIDDGAFEGCSSLDNITMPNKLTEIEDMVFSGCGLTSITIPNSVRKIGGSAFYGCKMESIIIPNSVYYIDEYAFGDCRNLTSLTIPSSVSHIGQNSFEYCYQLKEVYCLAPKVPDTDFDAFYNVDLRSVTLYVPASVLDDYSDRDPWCEFGKIVTLDVNQIATGKVEVETTPVMIKNYGSVITVEGLENNSEVKVYSASGTLIGRATATNHTATIPTLLTSGNIAIVDSGKKAVKVVVR